MQLEQQVINFFIAKKLKELGVRQVSLWYLCQDQDRRYKALLISSEQKYDNTSPYEEYYSAFTVAELGELLPDDYISFKENKEWNCVELSDTDEEWWLNWRVKQSSPLFEEDTEANARGKMLIYLLENKLMEIPKT